MRTISKALTQRIVADPTVAGLASGPWLDVAPPPDESPRPVITYALVASAIEDMQCRSIVRRFRYLVAVEGDQDDADAVRNAAAALEDLLHKPTGWTPTGWQVARCAFVDIVERAYVEGDYRAFAIIGTLEIVAQQSS